MENSINHNYPNSNEIEFDVLVEFRDIFEMKLAMIIYRMYQISQHVTEFHFFQSVPIIV